MGLCSGERSLTLASCLGAYFLSMAMIYQMSPFFEIYAHARGASTETVGLIFAAMPASSFLGNLGMTAMIRRFGVEVMMNTGLVLLALSSLGFGLSDSVPWWLVWRALQGLATAPIYTSISTRLVRSFTGDGEFHQVVGLQEVFGNLGISVGPLLGGSLFQWGGFLLPFATSAALHLAFVGLSLGSLLFRKDDLSDSESASTSSDDDEEPVTVCSVVSLRLLLLAGIPMLCLGVWGGYEPLLGNYFVSILGPIDHSLIGLLLSLAAIPSTFGAMATPWLVRHLGPAWLMAGGLWIYASGSWCLGVPQILSPWGSQLIGLLLIGVGYGFAWTPSLPSMVDQAAATLPDAPDAAAHKVSAPVSSIFNAAAALGEALGPLLGTWLLPHHFGTGAQVVAAFLAIYALTLCGRRRERPVECVRSQTRIPSVLPNE